MSRTKLFLMKLGVALMVIELLIFGLPEVWGFDWKYYGTNDEGSYFYEFESIKQLSPNIIRVCVQSVYTDRGISHWVREGGKEFQNLYFSLVLSEYHCIERSIRHLNIRFYSKDEKIFYPIQNNEWHFLVPDPMSESLLKEICK